MRSESSMEVSQDVVLWDASVQYMCYQLVDS
jgi:hypothetical protein